MSVKTQIDRIKAAKEAIATAIAEKGVTVPVGAQIDGMAGLIAAIVSGGGMPEGVSALASGEYVPSSDINSRAFVDHGLGVTPNFCVWVMTDAVTEVPESAVLFGLMVHKEHPYGAAYPDIKYLGSFMFWGYDSGKNSKAMGSAVTATNYFTPTQVALCGNASIKLKAGYKYRWVCGVIDGIL